MKSVYKSIVGSISVMIFSCLLIVTSSASFGESIPHVVSCNGRNYSLVSYINNEVKGEICYQVSAYENNQEKVPIGYIGCDARLYRDNGDLVKSTGYDYNPTESWSYLNVGQFKTTSGYYYSEGKVKLFNSVGYTTYSSAQTTNFAPSRDLVASTEEKYQVMVNENGDTYGSELFLNEIGIQPDLVKAVASNGKIGYVYSKDLDDGVCTIEEAISVMNNKQDRSIPVYDCNGEIVIGEFIISA